MRCSLGWLLALSVAASPCLAQRAADRISPDSLRVRLFTIAHDSMGGRDTGDRGNFLAAAYVAEALRSFGIEPAGDSGTFFQTVPLRHIHVDTAVAFTAGGRTFRAGADWVAVGPAVDWKADSVRVMSGGTLGDSTTWPAAEAVTGRLVVFAVPPAPDLRRALAPLGSTVGNPRFAGAVASAAVMLDRLPADLRDQILQGGFRTDTTTPPGAKPRLLVSPDATTALFANGATVSGGVRFRRDPLPWAARNVVAVLRGSDPALAGTFVLVAAHNDHVGFTARAVDHDSVYAYNRVIRPMGADSPDREGSPGEMARVRAMRDSLAALRPSRPDSVFNGADDDGSGTVALIEVARSLAAGPRPRRSVIFVSHAAEEPGLVGSAWFTDHPTIPRDSILGDVDLDMIGRGDATDLPEGGPGYLEVVGSRRLSREYGDLFERVNATEALPFSFNYEYDRPGHPLQYYCRADHYSYARYGSPAISVSRGEHADYHQVTDEPQYIDYEALARVATLVRDFVRTVADLDHRPVVDGPRGDPHAPCRQ